MRRFLIFLACLMMAGAAGATNITIQFKDSTQIQDAHIYSNGPTNNYGRSKYLTVTNRVEVTVGCSYANNWKAAFRVPISLTLSPIIPAWSSTPANWNCGSSRRRQ
jgi:hypothetical protein